MAVDTASATSAMCLSQWRRTSERRFSLSVNWHNDKPLPTNAQHRAAGYLAARQILRRSQGSVADNPWYKKMHTRHSINLFYLFLWHRTRGTKQQKKKWIKGEKQENSTINIVVSPDGSWLISWLTTTVVCQTCIHILEIITIRLWTINRWPTVVGGTWKYDEPEVENVTRGCSPSVTFLRPHVTFSTEGRHISLSHERLCVICFVVWPTTRILNYKWLTVVKREWVSSAI